MDNLDELLKIKELLDSGIITEKEFQELKKNLLSVSRDVNQEEKKITSSKITEEIKTDKARNLESKDTMSNYASGLSSKTILYSPENKEQISFISNESNLEQEESIEKSKKPIIIGVAVLIFILFIGGIYFFRSIKEVPNNKEAVSIDTSAVSNDTSIVYKTPIGWKEEKSDIIEFSNSKKYKVVYLSANGDELEKKIKLLIYKFNTNKLDLLWESNKEEADESGSLEILKTKNEAMIVAIYSMGRADGYFVVNLDNKGKILPEKDLDKWGSVESNSYKIVITEQNQRIEYQRNGAENILKNRFSRDQMNPKGSILAPFRLVNGEIIADNNRISLSVGQTIAFIPQDNFTAESFNTNSISIHSNVWNEGDITFSEATRIKSGNYFTFDKKGQFDFVLCTKCDDSESVNPTFTIIVN